MPGVTYNYIYKSASELASLIREGKAKSTDIVTEHIERIKSLNGKINALVSLFDEEAIAEAQLCDKEASTGNFRGPLHGVPVTIKECFWIKGKKSNMNFKMLRHFVAPEDAVVVQRIRQSGAIILGQSNVPKSLIDFQVRGDLYPEGKNPYNFAHTPGGSTGGGSAAIAAGFSALELGSDFGGSVRIPSDFCGLYGLKPTERTVPLHGNIPLPKNANTFLIQMTQAGPLGRSVEDVELLWKIIKGPHESDRNVADINWKTPTGKDLSAYKIAWTDSWPGLETSEAIKNVLAEFAGRLAKEGVIIEKNIPDASIHLDSLKVYGGIFPYVVSAGTPWLIRMLIKWQLNSGLLKGLNSFFSPVTKAMNRGFKLRASHYGKMMLERMRLTRRWENFFTDYDFLICPVAFGPAYPRCKTGSKIYYEGKEVVYINYAWPFNACFNASGHPSLAIPLGLSKEGLPLGIQVVTKYWNEPELLAFGKKLSAITPGFIKPKDF